MLQGEIQKKVVKKRLTPNFGLTPAKAKWNDRRVEARPMFTRRLSCMGGQTDTELDMGRTKRPYWWQRSDRIAQRKSPKHTQKVIIPGGNWGAHSADPTRALTFWPRGELSNAVGSSSRGCLGLVVRP